MSKRDFFQDFIDEVEGKAASHRGQHDAAGWQAEAAEAWAGYVEEGE